MIKAEELRIGNYFSYGKHREETTVFKITFEIKDGHLINGQIPEEHCYSIPLSPEWLQRAGFVDTNSQSHLVYNEFGNIFQLNKINGTYEFVWGAVEIKYVHQLQNLYYALTGTELNFKS